MPTQSYAAGQFADADVLVNQVIENTPRDPNAWFMRLAFDQNNPDRQAAYTQDLDIAKRVFVTQASKMAKKIMGPVKIPGAARNAGNRPGDRTGCPARRRTRGPGGDQE